MSALNADVSGACRRKDESVRSLLCRVRGVETTAMMRRSDGVALIDILFVCGIISVLSTIALPRLVLAKQSAGAASAIGSLRAINSGQLTCALTCGGGFYAPSLVALGQSPVGGREGFVPPALSMSSV